MPSWKWPAIIPAVYLAARELLDETVDIVKVWTLLLAVLVTAVSYCHLNCSRIGLRVIWVPFFACLLTAALWRGLHRGSRPVLAPPIIPIPVLMLSGSPLAAGPPATDSAAAFYDPTVPQAANKKTNPIKKRKTIIFLMVKFLSLQSLHVLLDVELNFMAIN